MRREDAHWLRWRPRYPILALLEAHRTHKHRLHAPCLQPRRLQVQQHRCASPRLTLHETAAHHRGVPARRQASPADGLGPHPPQGFRGRKAPPRATTPTRGHCADSGVRGHAGCPAATCAARMQHTNRLRWLILCRLQRSARAMQFRRLLSIRVHRQKGLALHIYRH